MTKEQIQEQLEELNRAKEEKQSEIDRYELYPGDYAAEYDDMLDMCYGPIKIGVLEFSPSRILEKLDPTAYRIGLQEYVDNIDLNDIQEYRDLLEELEEIEEEISDLEDELAEQDQVRYVSKHTK